VRLVVADIPPVVDGSGSDLDLLTRSSDLISAV
jgi:hypothetical protein